MATFLVTFLGSFWLRKNLATFWATFSGSFWLRKNLATFWATFDKNLATFSQHFLAALNLNSLKNNWMEWLPGLDKWMVWLAGKGARQ